VGSRIGQRPYLRQMIEDDLLPRLKRSDRRHDSGSFPAGRRTAFRSGVEWRGRRGAPVAQTVERKACELQKSTGKAEIRGGGRPGRNFATLGLPYRIWLIWQRREGNGRKGAFRNR
jgi:hypothetical protein